MTTHIRFALEPIFFGGEVEFMQIVFRIDVEVKEWEVNIELLSLNKR